MAKETSKGNDMKTQLPSLVPIETYDSVHVSDEVAEWQIIQTATKKSY